MTSRVSHTLVIRTLPHAAPAETQNHLINYLRTHPHIPSDEERGIEILIALLDRYPLLIVDDASPDEATEPEPASEMQPAQIVDLAQWIVAVSSNGHKTAQEPISLPPEPTAKPDIGLSVTASVFGSDAQPGLNTSATQLGFDF